MDIIVTTPKSQMANAAREADDCLAAGGGEYFRRFAGHCHPKIGVGERVYYVEDGFVRGFALVSRTFFSTGETCDTTGRRWAGGFYVFMDASSWQWITPIAMIGFQGYQYATTEFPDACMPRLYLRGHWHKLEIVGGWRDPKPEVSRG